MENNPNIVSPAQPIQSPPPPPAPAEQVPPQPAEPAPSQVSPPEESPKKGRRSLYIILIVLLLLILFGGLSYAYFYATKQSSVTEEVVQTEQALVTPTPTEEPAPSVENDSDLDGIINELDTEDATLEAELNSFDKESNF
ncbi:MAG: hypothetical protein UT87_C0007G0033 [Candidatus Levybacteria bacterium GW2011_GWC1_40_19]|nr:MAG: hypothetical protein UT46_C0004G0018 [Candidatus Levybacteria bacterium GW2011_GWA1_39_34]KKR51273.1 MAG: hypothetical protein UT87_C0007G0033 [Candidatus Levybacteria bacterium GW2011_GWC1_40_19]KKR94640.1 MAG: hypothetical protein UU45_C0008G0040 [Candidatus Levybacteria bacterium GW2011_GWA2_41_15]KKS02040.1 MAG: hypothetical protein UU52_C0004G0018 [Candidatus Levybacteria bacterium GW2011_GWB1_41_21]